MKTSHYDLRGEGLNYAVALLAGLEPKIHHGLVFRSGEGSPPRLDFVHDTDLLRQVCHNLELGPVEVTFNESERASTAWSAAAWQNSKTAGAPPKQLLIGMGVSSGTATCALVLMALSRLSLHDPNAIDVPQELLDEKTFSFETTGLLTVDVPVPEGTSVQQAVKNAYSAFQWWTPPLTEGGLQFFLDDLDPFELAEDQPAGQEGNPCVSLRLAAGATFVTEIQGKSSVLATESLTAALQTLCGGPVSLAGHAVRFAVEDITLAGTKRDPTSTRVDLCPPQSSQIAVEPLGKTAV